MCKSKAEGGQRCYGHTANAAMTSWAAASSRVAGQTRKEAGAAAQETFDRLRKEGQDMGVPTPSREEVDEFLEQQESRVRSSDISDSRKTAILTRLQQTREIDKVPDGATWHAWQNVGAETERAATDNKETFRKAARERAREENHKHVEKLQSLHKEMLTDPEKLQAYVDSRSKFRRYSPNNQLLITAQRPDATAVASAATWRELGRDVKEDEKSNGIAIMIPLVSKRTETNPETGEDEEKTYTRFGTGHVYDISQTEGKPLPTLAKPVTADAPKAMTDHLDTVAQKQGITVSREPLGDPDSGATLGGYYQPHDRSITINSQMPAGHQAKTYAHELAHANDPALQGDPESTAQAYAHGRPDAEAVAETAAYVFSQRYGHDTSGYSAGYVTGWCGKDTEKLKTLLPRIDAALDAIMPEDPTDNLLRDASKKARAKSSAKRAERKKQSSRAA